MPRETTGTRFNGRATALESSKGTQTMKIVVIGGTGLIGSKTVPILRQRGHEVIAASPQSGVNTIPARAQRDPGRRADGD